MVAFGECGFVAEIPAFAGMEGGGMIARIFREAEHCIGRLRRMRLRRRDSRLRGNGRRGAIARIFREAEHCIGRLRRMRLRRRDSRVRGNGRRGGDSENFLRSGTLHCSPSANAASPQRFRLSPEWKEGGGRFSFLGVRCKNTVRGWGDSRFRGNGNKGRE